MILAVCNSSCVHKRHAFASSLCPLSEFSSGTGVPTSPQFRIHDDITSILIFTNCMCTRCDASEQRFLLQHFAQVNLFSSARSEADLEKQSLCEMVSGHNWYFVSVDYEDLATPGLGNSRAS